MVIIGAKGFAKEVLEVIYQEKVDYIVYFFDNVTKDMPEFIFNKFRVLRNLEEVAEVFAFDHNFCIGIGNPHYRKELSRCFEEIGGNLKTIISPHAKIGKFGISIGLGCTIMSGTILTTDIAIGKGCLINLNCTIGHDCIIGDFVEMSPGVHVSGNCTIGDFCNLGTNCTILPKVKIGNNVTVGAGSVVTKDLPDNITVVGIPAKPLIK